MIAAGVLSCLRELSRAEPVLVAVDDAQWLDASSAGALEFSLRRLGDDGRVVFLFSWRTDERGRAPIGGEGLHDGRIQRDFNGKNHAYVDNISLTLAKVSTTPPAPPPTTPPATGKATLVAICSGKTLVVTVRPAKGTVVSSVTFLVNTRAVGVDKKAPFTARIGTAGLPAQLKVGARVKVSGKTIVLTKAVKRC